MVNPQTVPPPLPPAVPSTQVQQPVAHMGNTVVLTPDAFRAKPAVIASEHTSNAITYGLVSALLGTMLGFSFSRGNASRQSIILTSTALCGALGVALGSFGKTREENYSEIFTQASRDPDFVGHVKREMGRRETSAFVSGALCGFWPIW